MISSKSLSLYHAMIFMALALNCAGFVLNLSLFVRGGRLTLERTFHRLMTFISLGLVYQNVHIICLYAIKYRGSMSVCGFAVR